MKKYFEQVKNFFREDFREVLGIYHDDEKIFLARLTKKFETAEVNFEVDLNDKISPIEQLAEKVSVICAQRGWKTSKVGLCLREGDAITFRTNFENVPPAEIDSAVKTWATSQAGKNAPYAFTEIDGEIWAETLTKTVSEEYISAWKKNSLNLCALTVMPDFSEEESSEGLDKAVFVAKIVAKKKSPNLLAEKIADWNVKKISLTAAAIFILILGGICGKIFYDYRAAENELDAAKKILTAESETLVLKKTLDTDVAEMKKINSLLFGKSENFSKLNVLIRLGKISGGAVRLKKINATENFVQLEGLAENPGAIEKYLSRLKNSLAANVKLENTSAAESGEINFTIRLIFENK